MNGKNGTNKKDGGYPLMIPPEKRVTNHKIRLPSNILREFMDQQAPDDILQDLIDSGYPVGSGTLLEAAVSRCAKEAVGGDKGFMKLTFDILEPKNGSNTTNLEDQYGEVDPEENTRVLEIFSAKLFSIRSERSGKQEES